MAAVVVSGLLGSPGVLAGRRCCGALVVWVVLGAPGRRLALGLGLGLGLGVMVVREGLGVGWPVTVVRAARAVPGVLGWSAGWVATAVLGVTIGR